MNGSPINGPAAPADMRDIRAVRETLERAVLIGDLREQNAALFRAEVRACMVRDEERWRLLEANHRVMLRHLERLVDVPATERVTAPPNTWQERAGAWLARPASTRALLYGLAVAGIGATLSGCLAQPLARALLLGSP
ncbi:MAG TPA: hypothetical protein PK141_00510 [Polyangiaceae bacterium]|nr:hypothetical protein [Polyangiaceae bacterium]